MVDVKGAVYELQAVGKQLLRDGLVWGNGGNMSVRTGPHSFLITGSGSSLGDLQETDFVECSLAGEVLRSAGRKPSKEAAMHGAVYAARPDINAIVHAHPFYGLMIAASRGRGACEPVRGEHVLPGAGLPGWLITIPVPKNLLRQWGAKAREANLLILDNHGILALDKNLSEAYMALQTFEVTSRMHITGKAAGITFGRPFSGAGKGVPERVWVQTSEGVARNMIGISADDITGSNDIGIMFTNGGYTADIHPMPPCI